MKLYQISFYIPEGVLIAERSEVISEGCGQIGPDRNQIESDVNLIIILKSDAAAL